MYGRKSPVAVVEGAESLSKGGQRLRGHDVFFLSLPVARGWPERAEGRGKEGRGWRLRRDEKEEEGGREGRETEGGTEGNTVD